jgi:hypothetical protein
LSLQFANPIYFLVAAAVIVLGWRVNRLTTYEVWVAGLLLLMPYVLRGYDNAMGSFGRFASVVVPMYPVMGWLLMRLGGAVTAAILSICAFLLGLYAALFSMNYLLF